MRLLRLLPTLLFSLPRKGGHGQVSEPGQGKAESNGDRAFYLKLGLACVAVGVVCYDPGLVNVAMPFLAVAAFFAGMQFAVRRVCRMVRARGRAAARIDERPVAPLHLHRSRRRDAGAA